MLIVFSFIDLKNYLFDKLLLQLIMQKMLFRYILYYITTQKQ